MEKVGHNLAEYYALIFFTLCGITLVTSYNSLLMFFLGIEILSIPLYILTGSEKRNLKGNEAALKYFLMGSFSTGLMLLGIAFLYGASPNGSFVIDDLWTANNSGVAADDGGIVAFAGVGFVQSICGAVSFLDAGCV